ncbi:hypothetical protein [Sphingobium indicum]|uniref:hypothetical protein n=1 Tax=Sphingobium indicum TaxID=332055 RepID=UPI0018C9F654|nr:hypothetical protein [Sphingobium indicum]
MAKSGMIGGEALDQHQLLSYELALAASELLAARTLLESPSAVEERLEYPAFAEAKLLVAPPMADNWPARRACAGWDMEQETPVANLWNVGDSVKSYGDGGTQTCADAGRMAAEKAVTSLASFGIADMRDAI